MLAVVAVVVGAVDPVLWVASIIAAFFSKGRWWVVPLAALLWGVFLEFVLGPQMIPGYAHEMAGYHLASALLNGFVVLGIATLIRKMMRKPAAAPVNAGEPAARE